MNDNNFPRPTFQIDLEELQKAIDFLAPRSTAEHHALAKRIALISAIQMIYEDTNFDIEFAADNDDPYYYNSDLSLALDKMRLKLKEQTV